MNNVWVLMCNCWPWMKSIVWYIFWWMVVIFGSSFLSNNSITCICMIELCMYRLYSLIIIYLLISLKTWYCTQKWCILLYTCITKMETSSCCINLLIYLFFFIHCAFTLCYRHMGWHDLNCWKLKSSDILYNNFILYLS